MTYSYKYVQTCVFVGVLAFTRACVRDENAWSTLCDECTCEEDAEHDSEEPERSGDDDDGEEEEEVG